LISKDKNLVATIVDLYFGGTDTIASMLAWMILIFTHFPDKQRKFYEEIESVVGTNRCCTLAERPNMLYTEALRFGRAPQGISHRAIKDTQFKGFAVKKDTLIMPNFH